MNEEALAHWGLLRQKYTKVTAVIAIEYYLFSSSPMHIYMKAA
jgi:hypothetical protein